MANLNTNNQDYIELRSFNLLGDLQDEDGALVDFMSNYDSGYVCDIISEIADNYIPIYNNEVWEYASSISEYIEEAIEEGLAPTDGRDIDLIKIFQSGYYVYYQRALYQNLDEMVYNMMASKVNEFLNGDGAEFLGNIDLDDIASEIESLSDSYDNNNKMSDIEYESDRIIQAIKDEEFELQA